MEFKDFNIGTTFFTGGGGWKVLDKGTKLLVAAKMCGMDGKLTIIKTAAWPNDCIFYDYDFDGCYKTIEEVPGYGEDKK